MQPYGVRRCRIDEREGDRGSTEIQKMQQQGLPAGNKPAE